MPYTGHMKVKDLPPEKLYTRQHVAMLLSVSTKTVDRILRRENLPVVRIGALIRIPQSTLDDMLVASPFHKEGV